MLPVKQTSASSGRPSSTSWRVSRPETARQLGSARPTYAQWPAETVGALQAHRLLLRARPARTVLCPGCEADRVMPVQTIPAGPREAA